MRHQKNYDVNLWLREAKKLQRRAQSASIAGSLPVLRRLINTHVLTNITLPQLRRDTNIIQRKHILNMLAIEAGFSGWAKLKQKIVSSPEGQIRPYSVELQGAGYPMLWFSNDTEANAYAEQHGGKVVRVSHQAVVMQQTD